MSDSPENFSDMRSRLDEITNKVSDESTSLDDALRLFEEAVNIGLMACDMAELPELSNDQSEEADDTDGDEPSVSDSISGISNVRTESE